MELQVLRERVDVERLVGEAMEQTVVEGEVALPGGIRDEAHVLHTGARLVLASANPQNNRLGMDGTVIFQVLYTQGDQTLRALEANSSFTHWMDFPDVVPGMRAQTTGRVLQASAQPAGGRLTLRAEVEVGGRVWGSEPVSVVTGIEGVPDLQTQRATLSLLQHVGDGKATALLREEYDLPETLAITETLMAQAWPQQVTVTAGEGRAMVEGTVLLEVYHASANPDKPLVATRYTLPFEQSMEMNTALDDDLHAHVTVQDVAASSVDAGDGTRLLRTETILSIAVDANRAAEVSCLQDAYTLTGDMIEMEQMPARCFASAKTLQDTQREKRMLEFPEGAKAARNVLAAFVEPVLADSQTMGDREVTEGVLETTILYLPVDANTPLTVTQEIPFRVLFQGTLPTNAWMQLSAQEVDASLVTPDRVEVQYRMCLRGEACGMCVCKMPVDAKAVSAPVARGGMILVFPQAEETMWDLARRFRVTEASIAQVNPNLETFQPDHGVVIYQRVQG